MKSLRLVVLLLLLFAPVALPAQKRDADVSIGRSYTVWSDALQEQRKVLVYLPPNYDRSRLTYPVVYLLDGDVQFHHITGLFALTSLRLPDAIVVAVVNTHRTKDLTPPTSDRSELSDGEDAGGAPRFLDFMTQELRGWVDTRYRTAPYTVLIGHSYAGLFGVYALLHRPESFNAYILLSPSLDWDHKKLLADFAVRTPLPGGRPQRFLWFTCAGHEPETADTTAALTTLLKDKKYPDLDWHFKAYPDYDHSTVPHLATYDGLMQLFHDRVPPHEVILEGDPARMKAWYADLSRRYGYEIKPSANTMMRFVWAANDKGRKAEGLQLAQEAAAAYPYLPQVLDVLGAGLEAAGRFEEAERVYKRSMTAYIEGETLYGDPEGTYRDRHARLQKKIAGRPANTGSK